MRGFDSEVMAKSLEHLLLAVRGRGNKPKVMNDYELSEMDQSWRMHKVADDLKFALKPESYFSPYFMA